MYEDASMVIRARFDSAPRPAVCLFDSRLSVGCNTPIHRASTVLVVSRDGAESSFHIECSRKLLATMSVSRIEAVSGFSDLPYRAQDTLRQLAMDRASPSVTFRGPASRSMPSLGASSSRGGFTASHRPSSTIKTTRVQTKLAAAASRAFGVLGKPFRSSPSPHRSSVPPISEPFLIARGTNVSKTHPLVYPILGRGPARSYASLPKPSSPPMSPASSSVSPILPVLQFDPIFHPAHHSMSPNVAVSTTSLPSPVPAWSTLSSPSLPDLVADTADYSPTLVWRSPIPQDPVDNAIVRDESKGSFDSNMTEHILSYYIENQDHTVGPNTPRASMHVKGEKTRLAYDSGSDSDDEEIGQTTFGALQLHSHDDERGVAFGFAHDGTSDDDDIDVETFDDAQLRTRQKFSSGGHACVPAAYQSRMHVLHRKW